MERATYQPYGAIETDYRTARWANFREAYKFTGKEDDIEVGLTYFGGRYYAPQLGRWMSPDPVAVHSQKGNLNVYAYAERLRLQRDRSGQGCMMMEFRPAASIKRRSDDIQDVGAAMSPTALALGEQWNESSAGSVGVAALNGVTNSVSDGINGVSHLFGGPQDVVPTLAPGASTTNVLDAVAYGLGGLVGSAVLAVVNAVGFSKSIGEIGVAAVNWAENGAAVGGALSGLAGVVADTRGAINAGILLGGAEESMEGAAQGAGFSTFEDFKAAAGPAGPSESGMQWHHLVEQNPANVARFAPEALHNTGNPVRLPDYLYGQLQRLLPEPVPWR